MHVNTLQPFAGDAIRKDIIKEDIDLGSSAMNVGTTTQQIGVKSKKDDSNSHARNVKVIAIQLCTVATELFS